jgi:hypothetical protein
MMMSDNKPIYVNIEKHREIISIMEVVERKISAAKTLLLELEELKRKEDEEMVRWERSIEDIEHKIRNIKDQLG